MKAFRLIVMALVAMCLCMNFASCSNEDVVSPEDPQEEKYVTVGLGCTGELVEFSESQMGRAATDELYGIQVYAITEVEREYHSRDTYTDYEYTPYAYGVFASLDNVKIRLLQGQKYKFEVGIVIDPYKYRDHIITYFGQSDKNTSEFSYSSSQSVDASLSPSTYSGGDTYFHDRYYGELDMYTPEEDGTVDIHTKRVAYGVRYETIGLATDENFTIEVSQSGGSYKLYSLNVGSEPLDDIYTFNDICSAWRGKWNQETQVYENYTSNKILTISWNKADGTVVPMGSYLVTFKRNVKTTIRINAEANDLENGIRVFKEDVPMVNDDNIYEITGGSVVEIPVTPGN